ncbi:MAG: glycosyltransferase family 2 protein [Pseudomonadota bacterium]
MSDNPPPWLTVIIVNYNGKRFLQGALDSLSKQTDQEFQVILADNASSDGSLDGLRTDHLPAFELLASDENLGFAGGNNLAAKHATTPWIALLNPDAAAFTNWVAELRHATEVFPNVNVFAGATLNMDRPDIMDGAGDAYFGFGLPWRGGYGRTASEMPSVGTCFSPCGAAALYKREVFLGAGGFPEAFFCFCEDVDLAFQLRLQGETCVFWPDAKAYHVGGGTTGPASSFAVYHGARNRAWTFFRNMPPVALAVLLPFHFLLTAALILRAGARKELRPTLRGLRDAFFTGQLFAGRKGIQARRTVSSWQIMQAFSWSPLRVLGKKPDVRPLKIKDQ